MKKCFFSAFRSSSKLLGAIAERQLTKYLTYNTAH